jgi:molybdopterin converting factor small subunit
MAETTLRLPVPLRSLADGNSAVALSGGTVREVLESLAARYPALREHIFEGSSPTTGVNLYVNREDVRYLSGLETSLHDQDEIVLLTAASGG